MFLACLGVASEQSETRRRKGRGGGAREAAGGDLEAVDSDSPHRVLTPPGRVLRTRPTALTAVGRFVVDEGEVGGVDFAAPLQGVGYFASGSGGAGEGVAGASEHHAAAAVYS